MHTIFLNFQDNKTSDLHRLLLNFSDKIDLKRTDKYVILSNLSMYYTRKNIKCRTKTIRLKYQLQSGMKNLNFLTDQIPYEIFKIILSISSKQHETLTYHPPGGIYVNKIENSTSFKIQTGYYQEPLTTETIKLLGSTKSEITKDGIGENVLHLEITEVVLFYCNIVNNDYQDYSRVLYTFFPNKSFDQRLDISPKSFIFLNTLNLGFSYIKVWSKF